MLFRSGTRQLVDAVDRDDFDTFGFFDRTAQVARHDDPSEPEPGSFADTLFRTGGGAHFARQADFSRQADPFADRTIVVGGDHRCRDREVQSRIGDLESAGEVEEYVLREHLHSHAFFEHGEQHVHTFVVVTGRRALRSAVSRVAYQCLHFDQVGADRLLIPCIAFTRLIDLSDHSYT